MNTEPGSFELFMSAGEFFAPHLTPWLMWMQLILMMIPLLFILFRGAQLLLVSQVLVILTAWGLFVAAGNDVNKLFGLSHIFLLLPLAIFIRDVRGQPLPATRWAKRQGWYISAYKVFAALAALTIIISLVFDVRDVAVYLTGDTGSILVGVPEGHPLAR